MKIADANNLNFSRKPDFVSAYKIFQNAVILLVGIIYHLTTASSHYLTTAAQFVLG